VKEETKPLAGVIPSQKKVQNEAKKESGSMDNGGKILNRKQNTCAKKCTKFP